VLSTGLPESAELVPEREPDDRQIALPRLSLLVDAGAATRCPRSRRSSSVAVTTTPDQANHLHEEREPGAFDTEPSRDMRKVIAPPSGVSVAAQVPFVGRSGHAAGEDRRRSCFRAHVDRTRWQLSSRDGLPGRTG
jgi:hypothetical protein